MTQHEQVQSPVDTNRVSQPNSHITRKDRLSLLLAIVSLLVSALSLTLTRLDSMRASSQKSARTYYESYQLGDQFGQMLFAFSMITGEDAADLEKFRTEIVNRTKNEVQPIADRLDLRLQTVTLLTAHFEDNNNFSERVLGDLGKHVMTVHGAEALELFKLGHHTFLLYAFSQVFLKKDTSEQDRFLGNYINSAEEINIELRKLGIRERLSPDKRPLGEVGKQILIVRHAIDNKLASDRG